MATLIPDIEKAKAMKQKPTAGEVHLLEFLEKNLNPTSEVFFQPCFNGDRPDVVIMEKGLGIIVIVKLTSASATYLSVAKGPSFPVPHRLVLSKNPVQQPCQPPSPSSQPLFHHRRELPDVIHVHHPARIKTY